MILDHTCPKEKKEKVDPLMRTKIGKPAGALGCSFEVGPGKDSLSILERDHLIGARFLADVEILQHEVARRVQGGRVGGQVGELRRHALVRGLSLGLRHLCRSLFAFLRRDGLAVRGDLRARVLHERLVVRLLHLLGGEGLLLEPLRVRDGHLDEPEDTAGRLLLVVAPKPAGYSGAPKRTIAFRCKRALAFSSFAPGAYTACKRFKTLLRITTVAR